ncbi:MAG TPA: HEAT repeat domain-containing protein [Polyangiaceae bacterium]
MGLFDFFSKAKDQDDKPAKRDKGGKSDREMARFERLVSSKMTQNLDRQDAIRELSEMGTARAARVLLKRFNWSMEPSITDQEEKEAAAAGIVAAGAEALGPIREYCQKAESLHWPLSVLKDIVGGDELVEELLGVLDQFDTEYLRNPEPKVQLLERLRDYPTEDVRIAVEPFVGDVNESVRFAAATTVLAIGNPASVEALVAALDDEESLRIKNKIAQGLEELGWEIPEGLIASATKNLPPGFTTRAGKVARG